MPHIANLCQAQKLTLLPSGRHVVVIGTGMKAVNAAVQSLLLGAQEVILLYRRGEDTIPISGYEQELVR